MAGQVVNDINTREYVLYSPWLLCLPEDWLGSVGAILSLCFSSVLRSLQLST